VIPHRYHATTATHDFSGIGRGSKAVRRSSTTRTTRRRRFLSTLPASNGVPSQRRRVRYGPRIGAQPMPGTHGSVWLSKNPPSLAVRPVLTIPILFGSSGGCRKNCEAGECLWVIDAFNFKRNHSLVPSTRAFKGKGPAMSN
jgi:hypothetical protein